MNSVKTVEPSNRWTTLRLGGSLLSGMLLAIAAAFIPSGAAAHNNENHDWVVCEYKANRDLAECKIRKNVIKGHYYVVELMESHYRNIWIPPSNRTARVKTYDAFSGGMQETVNMNPGGLYYRRPLDRDVEYQVVATVTGEKKTCASCYTKIKIRVRSSDTVPF